MFTYLSHWQSPQRSQWYCTGLPIYGSKVLSTLSTRMHWDLLLESCFILCISARYLVAALVRISIIVQKWYYILSSIRYVVCLMGVALYPPLFRQGGWSMLSPPPHFFAQKLLELRNLKFRLFWQYNIELILTFFFKLFIKLGEKVQFS